MHTTQARLVQASLDGFVDEMEKVAVGARDVLRLRKYVKVGPPAKYTGKPGSSRRLSMPFHVYGTPEQALKRLAKARKAGTVVSERALLRALRG